MYGFEMKINIFLCFILLNLGCDNDNTQNLNLINIKWRKITNTQKPVLFCQIDSIPNGYLLSYSYSGTNQGFKIMKITDSIGTIKRDILFESNNGTIRDINVNENNIGFIKYGFNGNVLNTSLIISNDVGKIWESVETPLENERAIVFTKEFILVDGSKGGMGEVLKSLDMGETWNKINTLNKGFKSFYLLNYDKKYKNGVLCEGAKSFNQRNNKLLFMDVEKKHMEELIELKGGNSYIKIISKNRTLHGVISKNIIDIYSLKASKIYFECKITLPKLIGELRNIYMGDSCYVMTAREQEIKGKTLTWVSCDKGKTWNKYKQENHQLVYNSFGELIVKDINNNVLIGSFTVGVTQ